LFFYPFHDLYTGGLYDRIAPQDSYKSPVNLSLAIQGAFGRAEAVGYNVTFLYPEQGLDRLSQLMAGRAEVCYGRKVTAIDVAGREIAFSDGESLGYDQLISTLPLNQALAMAGLSVDSEPDPATAVLVYNIGARRGQRCPDDHWLYNPDARSGFHRVGFYSNVDRSFLPRSRREDNSAVSIYVERAYLEGHRPTDEEVAEYGRALVAELQSWGTIEEVDVLDPTWIEVAYTWSWPGSRWRQQAMRRLEEEGIYQVGRYARWYFQGIADSVRDGFYAGSSFSG
jgi:protoporphyrinogen oxidase